MQKHTFSKYLPEPGKLCEDLSESIFAFTDGWVLTIDAACLLVSSRLLSGIPLKTIGEATQTLINGKMVNRVAVEVACIGGKKCWLLMCGRDAKDLCCFHPPSVQVFGAGKTMMTTTSRHWMPASLLNVYFQHVSQWVKLERSVSFR